MSKSLGELLSGDAPEQEAAPVEQAEATPEPQPRDEAGRFASKEGVEPDPVEEPALDAVPPAAAEPGLPKDVYEPLRAVRDENKALKEQIEALTKQFADLQPKPEPEQPVSIWEDEQGWQQQFGGNIVQQAVQQATLNARLDMSEMFNRQRHEDFDAMKASFLEMMAANPALQQQALADPDPWGRAYHIAKNASTMQELGATDLATLKEQIRAQIMAEMQAQMPAPQPGLPVSLSGERNVGTRAGPAWAGPKSLAEHLR